MNAEQIINELKKAYVFGWTRVTDCDKNGITCIEFEKQPNETKLEFGIRVAGMVARANVYWTVISSLIDYEAELATVSINTNP